MKQSQDKNMDKLIGACIAGNRKAQKEFFKMFYGKMLAVCMRYATNTDEAKDICQDGFVKVFSNLNAYESSGSIEGWIRKIMVNTAIDAYRKRKDFYLEFDDAIDYQAEEVDKIAQDEEQMINKIKVEVVMQLVQKLSPVYRTVLNLYVFENYSHKEIADELNISIGTSKSNLSKAKRNLKNLFEAHISDARK